MPMWVDFLARFLGNATGIAIFLGIAWVLAGQPRRRNFMRSYYRCTKHDHKWVADHMSNYACEKCEVDGGVNSSIGPSGLILYRCIVCGNAVDALWGGRCAPCHKRRPRS
jgi:hypothetical protein